LSAKNSQKLCSQHSQLAKAAKKRTSKKHTIIQFWLNLDRHSFKWIVNVAQTKN